MASPVVVKGMEFIALHAYVVVLTGIAFTVGLARELTQGFGAATTTCFPYGVMLWNDETLDCSPAFVCHFELSRTLKQPTCLI